MDQHIIHREMFISKAAFDKKTAEMRWAAVCSDDREDFYLERMSIELFEDFIERAKTKEEPPPIVRSDYWAGGLPYLSVAHYLDHAGKSSAGMATEIYIDGNRFKAKGIFEDNVIGNTAFKSVCKSITNDEPKPIRISIAFFDFQHRHEDEDGKLIDRFVRKGETDHCEMCARDVGTVVFEKGILVHLALTRIPANERTVIVGGLEVKSNMTTQLEDAISIVGEDLAEEVDERETTIVGKSDAIKIRSEEEVVEDVAEEIVGEVLETLDVEPVLMTEDQMEQLADKMLDKMESKSVKAVIRADHPLASVLGKLAADFDTIWVSDMTLEKKLQEVQEPFEEVAKTIQEKFRGSEPSTSESSEESVDVIVARAVAAAMQPLTDKLSILTQQLSVSQAPSDAEPVRRSISPGALAQVPAVDPRKPKSINQLAQESTGQF